ncbi:MAG TPA: glycosyl hydrolase family 5, partial [Segetibacter sp.]
MKRRIFVKTAGLATAALALSEITAVAGWQPVQNKLPKWKGFNLLDFFSPDPKPTSKPTTEDHFRWMRDWGFDFVRIP